MTSRRKIKFGKLADRFGRMRRRTFENTHAVYEQLRELGADDVDRQLPHIFHARESGIFQRVRSCARAYSSPDYCEFGTVRRPLEYYCAG